MPRDLFADPARAGRAPRASYLLALSVLTHVAAIGALLVLPLIATDTLPAPHEAIAFIAAPRFDVSLPPAPAAPRVPSRERADAGSPSAAPAEAPSTIAPETSIESGPEGSPDGVDGGLPPGLITRDISTLEAGPPLPPPPASGAAAARRPRLGGHIVPPRKLVEVQPVYPSIARAARVQGVVVIEARIGRTGAVENARAVRSLPLLDEAALAAVRQWRFAPARLNGEPVEVVITVTVEFTLEG